jgi:iron-sulfur cluster repair protein YtfE (RIC family)
MHVIAELCGEHRQLEEQASQLMEIAGAAVPDPATVAMIRWRLAQALSDHCAREDRAIYDNMLASGDVSATAIAWAFRREHGALAESFGRYIGAWPVDRIAREWARFRVDTHAVLEALADRIACEEDVLYAHAERVRARRAA